MNQLWKSFLRRAAGRSNSGSIREHDGIEAAWVHSTMPINNATYLTSPVQTAGDLQRRLALAAQDAAPHQFPWAFFLFDPLAAALSAEQTEAAAASAGFQKAMDVKVMTADSEKLLPPARPLPELEFRRIAARNDAWTAFDINIRSYHMPPEMTDSILQTDSYFSEPDRDFGFLALKDGVPVSTATVVGLEGWLYVALVATDPGHRQMGYAEAVMRHALQTASSALGLTRTSLDATAAGAPVYDRMGYQSTGETWSMYMAAQEPGTGVLP